MRSAFSAVVAVVSLVLMGSSPDAPAEGYKDAKWGMDRAAVLALLPGATDVGTGIAVKTSVGDMPVLAMYRFAGDRLAQVDLDFDENTHTSEEDVERFDRIVRLLAEKYGKPKLKTNWGRFPGKHDASSRPSALALGSLLLEASWSTPKSKVLTQTYRDGLKTVLGISYTSKELAAQLQKEEDARSKAADSDASRDL